MFVESFQGQYKDGTDGTCDFRIFSASFLILRILIVSVYTLHRYDQGFIMWIQSGLFICATCFHAIARPYKTPYMNSVDILILSFLCSMSLGIVRLLYLSHGSTFKSLSILSVLLLSVPHIALMFYTCFKLAEKTGVTQFLKIKYTNFKACILTMR